MNNYTYTEWNDGSVTIYKNGEAINCMDAFWICQLLNNLKKEKESETLNQDYKKETHRYE